MDRPRTRYAKNNGAAIAYQTLGDGPFDVVMVPGFVSNVEHWWEMPEVPRLLRGIASYARLIIWDKRGTGCSDPVTAVPTVEERMSDMAAVMDAAGSESAALFGISEGGPLSIVFAATYPQRTNALVLYGSTPRFTQAPGWPHGWDAQQLERGLASIERHWGDGALLGGFAPSRVGDPEFERTWSRFERAGASPGMARAVVAALAELDVRAVVPSVRAPTLVLHRAGDRLIPPEAGRWIAEHIEGARYAELGGADHLVFTDDPDPIFGEMEEFLTGARRSRDPERRLATVLFTDIVSSTERAAELGDRRWRELLERHHELVRRQLDRHRGHEVKSLGDGFLATFDGPARAIECACAIRDDVTRLGVEIRAGLHTGECEVLDRDVGGIAVHIGARVGALAGAGEVLVSSTVKDLVVGSGIGFSERGEHELKGVPGSWRLYAVED